MHRSVECAQLHVDRGQPAQRPRDGGHTHLPLAGVGEHEHVGREIVGERGEVALEVRRADLLFAFDEHLHVARQRAARVEPGAHRGGVREHTGLVVAHSAGIEPAVALVGLERIRRPVREHSRRLHIVVRVEQQRRLVGARVQPFAEHARVCAFEPQHAHVLEPVPFENLDRPLRARLDLLVVLGRGADTRDAREIDQFAPRVVETCTRGIDHRADIGVRMGHALIVPRSRLAYVRASWRRRTRSSRWMRPPGTRSQRWSSATTGSSAVAGVSASIRKAVRRAGVQPSTASRSTSEFVPERRTRRSCSTAPTASAGANSARPTSCRGSKAEPPTSAVSASCPTGASPVVSSARDAAASGVATAALAGALDLIAGLGGGTVEGYPEDASAVPAGFLFNGALSTYEQLGFERDRKIGKHRWVMTKVVAPKRRSSRTRSA